MSLVIASGIGTDWQCEKGRRFAVKAMSIASSSGALLQQSAVIFPMVEQVWKED